MVLLKTKRIKQIEEYVFEHQTVSLDELVEVFNVSKNTIRRDVQELVDYGDLKKVYGGVSVNRLTLESFQDRKVRHQLEKEKIAEKAASFVKDGDIIFIDSGTTTLEMIKFLTNKQITIITNNLDFISHSIPFENIKVISTGGILDRKTKSFTSFTKLDLLKSHNINKAFMASTGISITNGVTNSEPLETETKQVVVERSAEIYLLVDHSKFDKTAIMTYCGLDEIDYLITDQEPNQQYQEFASTHQVELIVAEE
jgi:DeoR family transcriptional regulator, myo-inositol catabolism operon repressor